MFNCLVLLHDPPRNPAEVLLWAVNETFFTDSGIVYTDCPDATQEDHARAIQRAKLSIDFYRMPLDFKLRALMEDYTFYDIISAIHGDTGKAREVYRDVCYLDIKEQER